MTRQTLSVNTFSSSKINQYFFCLDCSKSDCPSASDSCYCVLITLKRLSARISLQISSRDVIYHLINSVARSSTDLIYMTKIAIRASYPTIDQAS